MAICKCSLMGLIFFPLHAIVMSSANSWVFISGLRLMVMSLIPIKNNVGLITDPCGTPFSIITGCDRDPFALTWIDLSDRKLVMKDSILPFTFNSMRELIILILEIVSRTFSISRHTATMYSSWRKASQIFVSKFV